MKMELSLSTLLLCWLLGPNICCSMRIREPKTTALIFASGKMVVTGAKSEDDSKLGKAAVPEPCDWSTC